MSSQAIIKPPSKATYPSSVTQASKIIEPSKTIDLAGKNSMKPMNLGTGPVTVVAVLLTTPEQVAQLSGAQPSQQPITINLQQNNITNHIHNYSQHEPPKHGIHEGSRDRLEQGLQGLAPPSRSIQNRPSGMDNSPSSSTPAQIAYPNTRDSAVGRPKTPQPAQEQKRQTRDVPKRETNSAHTTRPASRPAASRSPQEGDSNSASSSVAAAPVQGQAHQGKTRSGNKNQSGIIGTILHTLSRHDNSSTKTSNLPTSTTTTPAREVSSSHPKENKESSVARRQPNHGDVQPPHRQNQAPSQPPRASPPTGQMPGPSHGVTQPRKQHDGAAGAPQGQPAVDQRNRAAPKVATALTRDDIKKYLGKLNELLAGSTMKTTEGPVNLYFLVNPNAAIMSKAQNTSNWVVSQIKVIIDDKDKGKKESVERILRPEAGFRVFDTSEIPDLGYDRMDFGGLYDECFPGRKSPYNLKKIEYPGEDIFEATHLEAEFMNQYDSLEFELRRLEIQDDEKFRKDERHASEMIVADLLRSLSQSKKYGDDTYKFWRKIRSKKMPVASVPDSSLNRIEELFPQLRHGGMPNSHRSNASVRIQGSQYKGR